MAWSFKPLQTATTTERLELMLHIFVSQAIEFKCDPGHCGQAAPCMDEHCHVSRLQVGVGQGRLLQQPQRRKRGGEQSSAALHERHVGEK